MDRERQRERERMWVLRNGLCLTRAVSHMHPSAVQRQINLAENLKSILKKNKKKTFMFQLQL